MSEILYHFFVRLGFGMLATMPLVGPRQIGRTYYVLNSLCALGLWIAALAIRSRGDLGLVNLWLAGAALALMLSFMLDPTASPRAAFTFVGLALALAAIAMLGESRRLHGSAFYNSTAFLWLTFLLSSLLVGGTMVAMILGHFYLVTPRLSFGYLARFTKLLGVLLVLRLAAALVPVVGGQLLASPAGVDRGIFLIDHVAFLAQRGLVLVALAALLPMIWDCVKRRANQSATGLLYVAAFLALMGEAVATYFAVSYRLPI
jgi:hypothetical protein